METTTKLGDGFIPLVGYGTYQMTDDQCEVGVPEALQVGYTHIDTAQFYDNHDGIRRGMLKAGIDRSKIFITDKVSPTKSDFRTPLSAEDIREVCKTNLARLGVNYVDLYLIHHGMCGPEVRMAQWKALCDLKSEGLIKHAGVSNWSIAHIEAIRSAGLPLPEANQIEIHPLCSQAELVTYCKEHNIVPIAYSSLAPLSTWRAGEGQQSAKSDEVMAKYSECVVFIKELAAELLVSEAQVLLKWALQHGFCILPKSTNPDRIVQNASLFHFNISDEAMQKLDSFDGNCCMAWPEFIGNPVNYP